MRKFIEEFKAFIKKGNVLDLAVGVIIGGAFGKIVTSLVADMLTPFIVLAVGKSSLSELVWTLRAAVVENGEIVQAALTVNWGKFLQTILDFLVIAFVIFMIIRTIVRAKSVSEKIAENAKNLVHKHILNDEAQNSSQEDVLEISEEEPAQTEPKQVLEEVQKEQVTDLKSIELLLTQIRDSLKK